jgi:hypothetical protein
MIDLARAFSFVSEDSRWWVKLGILTALGFGALLLFALPTTHATAVFFQLIPPDQRAEVLEIYPPNLQETAQTLFTQMDAFGPITAGHALFYGVLILLGFSVNFYLQGYGLELIRITRAGSTPVLPTLQPIGLKLTDGLKMFFGNLILWVSLPLMAVGVAILLGLLGAVIPSEALFTILILCGFLPLLLVWGFAIIYLNSVCLIPFSETSRLRDYFRIGWVWQQFRKHPGLSWSWFGLATLSNFGFFAVQLVVPVPYIGQLLSLAMQVPVQNHLLGQYAAALDERNGVKRKNETVDDLFKFLQG